MKKGPSSGKQHRLRGEDGQKETGRWGRPRGDDWEKQVCGRDRKHELEEVGRDQIMQDCENQAEEFLIFSLISFSLP